MFWLLFTQLLTFLLDAQTIRALPDQDKDLQNLLLHQQVRILQRTVRRASRISRSEKLFLAVLTARLKRATAFNLPTTAGRAVDLSSRNRSALAS